MHIIDFHIRVFQFVDEYTMNNDSLSYGIPDTYVPNYTPFNYPYVIDKSSYQYLDLEVSQPN